MQADVTFKAEVHDNKLIEVTMRFPLKVFNARNEAAIKSLTGIFLENLRELENRCIGSSYNLLEMPVISMSIN